MLTLYLAGNLLGRLLMSYLLVWLFCLFRARGNARDATRRTRSWPALLSLLLLFLLGLAGTLGGNYA